MPNPTPTDLATPGALAWTRIHGYARQVRVVSVQRTRCWVAWTTSSRCSRVSQLHVGELAAEAAPGATVSHVAPPSLSYGLAALDAELSRRRLAAANRACRRAERAARMAS